MILPRIELDALATHRLVERQVEVQREQYRAVAGAAIVGVIQHHHAARAGHVARDNVGVAGDVPAEVAGEQPGIDVIAAARRRADEDGHVLALVEVRDRIGRGAPGRNKPKENQHAEKRASQLANHESLPCEAIVTGNACDGLLLRQRPSLGRFPGHAQHSGGPVAGK